MLFETGADNAMDSLDSQESMGPGDRNPDPGPKSTTKSPESEKIESPRRVYAHDRTRQVQYSRQGRRVERRRDLWCQLMPIERRYCFGDREVRVSERLLDLVNVVEAW